MVNTYSPAYDHVVAGTTPEPASPAEFRYAEPPGIGLVRLKFRLLAALSTELAFREAWRMFCTPRRLPRKQWEEAALATARYFQVPFEGGTLAAYEWNARGQRTVLLVHGWEDDNALWGPAIDEFARWGRAVVVLDLPGHGFSAAEDASIDSATAAVMAAAGELGPISAGVGHSYGCAILIRALSRGLPLERAVMLASPAPRTQPRRPIDAEGVDPAVIARAEELRQAHTERQTAAIEAALRGLATPLLAIHSIDDDVCPLTNSQRMVDLAPRAELMLVDGLGHRLIAQDAEVLQHMVAFVEGA